jgi:hypothetical protein
VASGGVATILAGAAVALATPIVRNYELAGHVGTP